MIADFWSFLQDANNRAVLGWLGGGVVVAVGASWAVLKFIYSGRGPPAAKSPRGTVSATQAGVAAGRDIRDSNIDTRS